ncbi:hypothetical protein [Cellulomonas edaphi]|uniref:Uncharacterized protein n=1 Tax=Cellulomonas edaphi TaxID=3053468 RepID=A0ABT7S3R3_9CELL|nr:hypothetical protein [Cellulomons edaphi]MDM7830262.1 hypothetical protein [Cellulomons edaphi]
MTIARKTHDRTTYEKDAPQPGRVLDARLHLLDRQLLDVDDVPVTTIDDLEIHATGGDADPVGGPAVLTNLLTGPVLGTRILGGRPPSSRLERIAWSHVRAVDSAVKLGIHGSQLDATWVERWVRDHVIGRIPGGRHDPE